ncbi:MAG: hypothetical protein QXU69_04715 [Thermofilaceae archaeon]
MRSQRTEVLRIRCSQETKRLFKLFALDKGFSCLEDALLYLLAKEGYAPRRFRLE